MKPDGTTATVTADTKQYFNQMRIGANLAKINKYKNFYTERKITKQEKGSVYLRYKVDRQNLFLRTNRKKIGIRLANSH